MTIQVRIKTISGRTSVYEIKDVIDIVHQEKNEIVISYMGVDSNPSVQTARIQIDRLVELRVSK